MCQSDAKWPVSNMTSLAPSTLATSLLGAAIQEFLAKNIRSRYEMFDVNVYQENIFHTKMHLKDFDLDNYLFEEKAKNLSFKERMKIEARLKREIEELFHGRNLVE